MTHSVSARNCSLPYHDPWTAKLWRFNNQFSLPTSLLAFEGGLVRETLLERNENGPIVVFLFGRKNDKGGFTSALEQGVTENGVLATGTITADDLIDLLEG